MGAKSRVGLFKMTGESNLDVLLGNMKPEVIPGEYVFCTVNEKLVSEFKRPLLVYRENEGPTVIVTKREAEQIGISSDSVWGLVTLKIHSALEAVGFLAAVTSHLASAGISVNAVSAYYHDHLFVPYERVDEVVALLRNLSESKR